MSPVRAVNKTAAQVIGAFGAVDVPKKEWLQLLPGLAATVSSDQVPVDSKVASLEVCNN
jgi:hypothetical protein